ncbi:MAG: hypothetical protein AVDCRST_MAG54-1879, partial [uncultured Actinomycetospora sp.]
GEQRGAHRRGHRDPRPRRGGAHRRPVGAGDHHRLLGADRRARDPGPAAALGPARHRRGPRARRGRRRARPPADAGGLGLEPPPRPREQPPRRAQRLL